MFFQLLQINLFAMMMPAGGEILFLDGRLRSGVSRPVHWTPKDLTPCNANAGSSQNFLIILSFEDGFDAACEAMEATVAVVVGISSLEAS